MCDQQGNSSFGVKNLVTPCLRRVIGTRSYDHTEYFTRNSKYFKCSKYISEAEVQIATDAIEIATVFLHYYTMLYDWTFSTISTLL